MTLADGERQRFVKRHAQILRHRSASRPEDQHQHGGHHGHCRAGENNQSKIIDKHILLTILPTGREKAVSTVTFIVGQGFNKKDPKSNGDYKQWLTANKEDANWSQGTATYQVVLTWYSNGKWTLKGPGVDESGGP